MHVCKFRHVHECVCVFSCVYKPVYMYMCMKPELYRSIRYGDMARGNPHPIPTPLTIFISIEARALVCLSYSFMIALWEKAFPYF